MGYMTNKDDWGRLNNEIAGLKQRLNSACQACDWKTVFDLGELLPKKERELNELLNKCHKR